MNKNTKNTANNGRIKKLLAYGRKTFNLASFIRLFAGRRSGKQKNDDSILIIILVALFCKKSSLRAIERFSGLLGNPVNRSVLESFLKIDGLPRRLRRQLKAMTRAMQRGKMITLPNIRGRKLAAADGVEIYRKSYTPKEFYTAVLKDNICTLCSVSVHRDPETKEIIRYECYHRVIILSLITNRGPMPIEWEFQTSNAGKEYLTWIKNGSKNTDHPRNEDSAQEVKQTGEITAMKALMTRMHEDYNGYLPFDTIVADSLYDKATIIDLIESYGIALISGHKDERRILHKKAESDFADRNPQIWSDKKTQYNGWSGVYEDLNRQNPLKTKVKIIRLMRQELGKEIVDNYFYCSNFPWVTPKLVEWCRFYRWKLENGFNDWTNKWEVLKHMFHHENKACNAIIGLLFVAIILVKNFWCGNLNRGEYAKKALLETYEDFFDHLKAGIIAIGKTIRFKEISSLLDSS